MVAIGSKALPLRRAQDCNVTAECRMSGEDNSYNEGGRRKNMSRKSWKKTKGSDEDKTKGNFSGGVPSENFKSKTKRFSNQQEAPSSQTTFLRNKVDPETAKYFSEIANVIEGTEIDLEERISICGNALEETQGKEVVLATDYIISHTLQTLLEGCSVDQLCTFLQNCSKDFPCISMDRSGSHVAETALRSLAAHLQENEAQSLVEATLNDICQAIVVNPVDVMTNCHGSHVLRSLLCLCKGVPLDSDFRSKKSSAALAERLNFKSSRFDGNGSTRLQLGFPDMLKFLVSKILRAAKKDIEILQVDQYSSLVLQTALKMLVGYEQELLHAIPLILGCDGVNATEGNLIDNNVVKRLMSLTKETAFSHLMEVILEVAPESLYNELITKAFRNSLYEMSSHHCGNFVIQALISHARNEDHVMLIWKELGTRFKDIFGMGRSGVVASLVATSHRLHSYEDKCCQALIASVCMENEPTRCIVPRILFLDSYFYSKDKSNWDWPNGTRMHVMGTLILQSVFRLPTEFVHAFISSMTSLKEDQLLATSKDSGGARVIEAFLNSNASAKQKRKLVVKLKGHFGELSMIQSGSFTVEKCFNVSSMSLREVIVSELLSVQAELSKTKQGPHLLRKLDVEGYSKRPDQWKSRQTSRETAFNDFLTTFASNESKSSKYHPSFMENRPKSQQEKLKDVRKEIDTHLASTVSPFLAQKPFKKSGKKHHMDRQEVNAGKFSKHAAEDDIANSKQKTPKKRKHDG